MKNNKVITFLNVICIYSLIVIINISLPNVAYANNPFSCTIESFLFQSNGRNDPAFASSIDLQTGAVTELNNGNSFHDKDINAIGYNTTDNYIWGYDRAREKVARINSDFNVELFDISSLPENAYHIGDVSPQGILFLADQWIDKSAIYKVDVNPASANYKKYIGKLSLKKPDGSFFSNFFTAIADFAFNPIDGLIYTVKSDGTVYKIDPNTGVVSTVLDVGNLGTNAVAIFFDKNGYFYYDAHSKIYRIDMNNPTVPNNAFSNLSINAEGDAARCPNAGLTGEPNGATGNGTLRYANSGTGQYKDRILFMDWKTSSLEDGMQEGDVVNFTIPASTGMPSGTLKATFTNVDETGGIASKVIPHEMRTWGGAPFYQLYDTAGSGEAIYAKTQFNPNDESGDHYLSFDITWEMKIDGQTVAPDIFLIDAESTTENAERIDASTNGDVWSIIENAVNESYIVDGVGTTQIHIKDTEDENIDDAHPTSTEGSPLLLSKGVTQMSISLRTINSNGGLQAVAFALLAPQDHGDAPSSYGDAAHAFKEEPISPSKNNLGLQFTTGTPYFGTPPDSESARQEDALPSQGDDNNNDAFDTARDDDENIEIPQLPTGQSVEVAIPVNGAGFLQGWVDWNADGDFGDANEQVVANLSVNSGSISVTLNVPENAEIGNSFARFRISSEENLLSTGYAKDGEVEDIAIEITEGGICRVDYLDESMYSTSSVSANSNTLSTSTRVYQAKFDNASWEGHIFSYDLITAGEDGSVNDLKWDAADNMSRTGRKLFTYNPSLASNRGKIFAWSNFNNQQKSLLINGHNNAWGESLMGWVQGKAGTEGTRFRSRSGILGDIINSNLLFKDTLANYGYSRLPEGGDYPAFLSNKKDTTATLFIGANDGMLHAFDGNTGDELFAYIPNEVFSKLPTISDKKYGCKDVNCLPHEYLVDGKSAIGDAYFASSSDWHTILIGGLGLGGKGLFALDVTNAESFSASDVLWEISSTQATSAGSNASEFSSHLGNTIPSASVVRINNSDSSKQWAAVIGNGYESANHQAVLFIIDIETGALIKKINTNSGSEDHPNGLSTPVAVDSNNDSIVDRIYAGDLLGNLWAFDLSGNNPDNWGVDFSGTPLFSTSQAITAQPQVGKNKLGGLMVYFGSGKYFDVGDNMSDAPVSNTYYGIHDNGSPVASNTLVEQTILQQSEANGTDYNARVISNNAVDFSTHHGWFMNLPDAGERVISQALLRAGRLIFTTMTPPGNICEWGGTSWLMEFNAVDGKRLASPPLDINDDKEFTEADNVSYQGEPTVISGVQDTSLGVVFSTPAVINHNSQREGKYMAGTGGSIGMMRESASNFTGRMSWRKIR